MEDEKQVEQDRQRAEVFDALGHPTRIQILKALSENSLGFADLKKKTGIDSSGHLQHHLNKLNGLIKTDEYGKYCLSDQGKDALLTVKTVENASGSKTKDSEKTHSRRFNSKIALKSISLMLVALLIASSAIALIEHDQTTALQKEIANSGLNYGATAFHNQFGITPTTNVNSSSSPPVSIYRALQIGLEANGWNKTSLNGMGVSIYLMQQESADFTNGTGTISMYLVTSQPADYSDVYGNGVIYRYVWDITVYNSTLNEAPIIWETIVENPTGITFVTSVNSQMTVENSTIQPVSLVDASTGEMLSNTCLH